MSDDLVKRLEITGQMISMGERISWGVDSALMAEAATRIADLEAEVSEAQALIYAARQERNAAEDQEKELAEELRAVKAERDALAARVRELDGALTVKPLEWDDFSNDSFNATTFFGDYVVELHEAWGMWTPDEGELAPEAHSYHASPEAAKAAAQDDYETRILSTLTRKDGA